MTDNAEARPRVTLTRLDGYKFMIDFGDAIPTLLADEAEPYGEASGPSPEQLIAAGVANCLCASLTFALGKFRVDGGGLTAEAECRLGRNATGRIRIEAIEVAIALAAPAGQMERIDRVIEQFERFCTVSESVKAGVPVTVSVRDGLGARLK